MKKIVILLCSLVLTVTSFGQQEEKIRQLVSEGTKLHDEGKYEEAVSKYREALKIDKNSPLANYELSYTCMVTGKYDDAIYYSRKVLEKSDDLQEHAYLVLGSSFDLKKFPVEAISVFQEGLKKFPKSNLLYYNLALTAYNQGKLELAENSAIQAILSKPMHGSSHLVLASVMQDKEEQVKALLPMYYFLLMEPDSRRSADIYKILRSILVKGIEKKSGKEIKINVSNSSKHDSLFRSAETFLGLMGASSYIEANKDKTEYELFAETTKSLFSVLEMTRKEQTGIWWDLYVDKFSNLIHSGCAEAFSYYISQSANSELVNNWIIKNGDKMTKFRAWMKANGVSTHS